MKNLLLLLLLLPLWASSQVYFSNKYDFGGGNEQELFINDSGLVIVNLTYNDWNRLKITEVSLSGSPKGPSIDFNYNYLPSVIALCNGCFEPFDSARYFIRAQTNFDSSSFGKIHLVKHDRAWNILDSINYTFKDSLGSQIYNLVKDSDSTFVLTGYTFHDNGMANYDLLVAKFDTAFNLLWETQVKDGRSRPFGYRGGILKYTLQGISL